MTEEEQRERIRERITAHVATDEEIIALCDYEDGNGWSPPAFVARIDTPWQDEEEEEEESETAQDRGAVRELPRRVVREIAQDDEEYDEEYDEEDDEESTPIGWKGWAIAGGIGAAILGGIVWIIKHTGQR